MIKKPGRNARAACRACAVPLLAAGLFLTAGCGGRRAPAAKHVIFFIGDGMSAESEVAASRYLYGRDDGLAWQSLPARAYVATWDVTAYNTRARQARRPPYSRSSFDPAVGYSVKTYGARPLAGPGVLERFPSGPSTDSASAATALATGFKTDSGNIAWLPGDPPGGGLTTILEEVRARIGAAIGIISTVPFDHATPAAFVSHNPGRSAYYTGFKGYTGLGLADEIILKTKPDVVIGGGSPLIDNPDFDTRKGYISESLYRTLQTSQEYVFVERRPGQDGGAAVAEAAVRAAREGRKLFGLFGGKGGNFDVAQVEDSPGRPRVRPGSEENPSLAEAAEAALGYLARDPQGFFLVIEQGDIDWANHDNDYRAMIGAVADLDAAVRAALAYVDRPGDDVDWTNTVLLVTADHATGGLLLEPGVTLAAGDLPRETARADEHGLLPAKIGSDRGPANGTAGKKPDYPSPYDYPDGDVSYGTAGHTNELVDLAVIGAAARDFLRLRGTWYPGPILDNTQINAALREAVGLPRLGRQARRAD
ncbi:MAG TPA: alkaline phosphatase [Candidatus Aminicenantes bacterium]|nr:alkaline phosphatase [Candidatus Aminicenantes bacterium]HRY64247.1 alkaline phosphatase [Candidatus Aminicenantes bacterium]HRZ71160.1 alkaline phosphatase [Candidatus Aminicenantes bacterium]